LQKVEKELISSLFNEEFENYINNNLHNNLIKIEICRIILLIVLSIPWLFFIGIIIFIIFLCKESGDYSIFGLICPYSVPIFIGIYLFSQWIIKIFKRNTKKIYLPELLSYIGKFKSKNSKDDKNNLNSYISSLKLFSSFNIFENDDRFIGEYHNIPVDISEICIKRKLYKDSQIIFNGLLLSIPSNKEFNGTIIFREKGLCHIGTEGLNKINLEATEIEKEYDIFASDNIEARKILTPAFLVRLLELSKKLKTKIYVSFEQNKVNVAIQSKKDMFEIPIISSVHNINNYKKLLSELIEILSIIDTLHLDENIGM